ncbi:unnamed protein product [Psylliodes chrysocephalus]|uniref:Uncharacterized protein n=1 Tax=Psylliodes chrysocephalus TaxID=3402493 RepID=A0A9P0CHY1_9CUCU|nr:unnamed protein product [Psylliodes chrysocephala]
MNQALVPYSETSDSDSSDSNYPKKCKRRKRGLQVNKENWFAVKNKRLREKGQSYLGRIKTDGKWNYEKPQRPKQMKIRCSCQNKEKSVMKCAIITEDDRKKVFNHFWTDLTWGEKKVYIDNAVTIFTTKRHRDRKEENKSRRSQSLCYYLRIDGNNVRVCKTMFLNTLAIGRWTVLNWKNNFKISKISSNLRELKNDRAEPFKSKKEKLNEFLDSLPVMDSHYCRASSSKKYLLPEWPSKNALYNFYVSDWCKSHSIEPLSRTNFNDAFKMRNMALFRPKKDECEKCASYKVETVTEEDYQLHMVRKKEARLEKDKDKKEHSFVFTADMQAVFMAPKSQVSTLYYRTKLQVHNMCFYNLRNNDGFCFLWNETEGGLNSEEFASIWVCFLQEKILPTIDTKNNEIIIYSDGCCYQNRNPILANSLLNLAVTKSITIVQKYLEVGHTQMEADSI